MVRILEAVYEDGVLKPLADPGLPDHQRVIVEIRLPAEADMESELGAWQRVYGALHKQGRLILDADILIAATALVHDLILVTGNEDHFQRIPGLRFVNWRKADLMGW